MDGRKIMKIGLITIKSHNIGNRLQNYAVQEVLKKLGHDVYTMNNEYCGGDVTTFKHTLKICVLNRVLPSLFSNRRKRFDDFNSEFIQFDDSKWSYGIAPDDILDEFDYFVTGSDQVWNPHFDFLSSNEYLEFARDDQKIAISASLGVSEIPNAQIGLFTRRLKDYNAISVREDAGARIVKQLTDRDVPVLIDPTMMLGKEDWLKIARPHEQKPQGKYILTYFIGKQLPETKAFIHEKAEELDAEVVNLYDPKIKNYYAVNPSEYIDYIAHAELMCTDSFHGSIFSILMDTPFVVFDRKDSAKRMNSRIDTLLSKTNLEKHYFGHGFDWDAVKNVDYTRSYELLEGERIKFNEFLIEAIQ